MSAPKPLTEFRDNAVESRFELLADGELAAVAVYRRAPGVVTVIHTEVRPEWEGRGIGSKIAAAVLDEIRGRGEQVRPFCPFLRGYIDRHPEYESLVAA